MFKFIKKLFGIPELPEVKEMKPPVIEPIKPVTAPPQVKVKTTVKAVPAKKNHQHQKKDPAKITPTKKEHQHKKGPTKPKKK